MSTPVLHVVAGPDGSGKSTFVERILRPSTGLPFVNADEIAAREWPGAEVEHGLDASRLAARERDALLGTATSFLTETVFSHPSKVELVARAQAAGFLVHLHVVLVPVDLSVARVCERARRGGHHVPEAKIRARHARLWALVAEARALADRTTVYDNAVARTPFRKVATYDAGTLLGPADWTRWTPDDLRRS